MSKAQTFADKAETLDGWTVEKKRNGEHRIVTVTRGEEAFRFVWAPNETTGRVTFHSGTHRIGEDVEPYSNVTLALRIMAEPAGSVKSVSAPAERKTLKVNRLPFNPDADPDDAVIISLAGKRVEWQRRMDGGTESAHVALRSPHTKITRPKDDDSPGARILHFVDAAGESGFRSVAIGQIRAVKNSNISTKRTEDANSNKSARSRRSRVRRSLQH